MIRLMVVAILFPILHARAQVTSEIDGTKIKEPREKPIGAIVRPVSLEERVMQLEEQLANLQAESQRVFSFGAQLRAEHHAIDVEDDATGMSEGIDLNRMRFLFNTNATISPQLSFFGQFGASKYFNLVERQRYTEADANTNFYGSEQNHGNDVRLSRAYFEYYLKDTPMAVSIGRLPTMDGPPGHFRLNLPRQATYPQLAYNVEMDGVALSYWLDKTLPKDHKLIFRAIYTPFTHLNYNNHVKSVSRPTSYDGTKDTQDFVISGMIEYTVDKSNSWFDHAETILQYIHWRNGTFADVIQPAAPTDITLLAYPDSMLDLHIWTLYQEFTDLMGIGLDFSASYSLSMVDTKREALIDANPGNAGYENALGLRNDGTGTTEAGVFLISLAKTLPIKSLNRPKLGVEYLHGEKNLFSTNEFNQIEDETGFYATMGDAYHAYYSQDINENLSFQLGFRLQKQQYDIPDITLASRTVKTNLGSAEKDRKTIETVYLRGLLNF